MARTVRGCLTTWSQSEGKDKPETILNDPQQEGHPDTAEGGNIAEYHPDVNYEGSEPKAEPVAQEQWEEDPDAECAKMEMPRSGTLCQRMMPLDLDRGDPAGA